MDNRVRNAKWFEDVRKHYCIAAVGGSTLRGQYNGKGRLDDVRSFLRERVSLRLLSRMSARQFDEELNRLTRELSTRLPRPHDSQPNWGAARKALNIYLRMCAMNKDLNPAFRLDRIEPALEVPIDSHVAVHLLGKEGIKTFQIKMLTRLKNADLQKLALAEAKRRNVYRYELDVLFWNRQGEHG